VVLGGALAAHYLFQRIAFLERLTQLQASCLAGADCGELAERQRRDCESDRPTSCIQLGLQYRAGKGTEQDNSKAADLFDRACNRHKNPLGCFYLGFMHEQGWGRAPNDEIISSLYRYACNANA
jgi:TPR repeat protein